MSYLRFMDVPYLNEVVINVMYVITVVFLLSLLGALVGFCIWYYVKVEKKRIQDRLIIETRRNDMLNDISHSIYELREAINQLPKDYVREVLDDEK